MSLSLLLTSTSESHSSVVWRPWVLSFKCEDSSVTQNFPLASMTILTFFTLIFAYVFCLYCGRQ